MAEDTASRDAPDASRRSEASSADGSDDERRQQAAPGDFDPAAEWDTLTLPPSDPSMDSWAHVWANGRRYAAYRQGRYPLPNDETEQNRDDMKHAIMMELTEGRLFYAPLPERVEKVIDIGTGTGIWAIEMGDMFPDAQVLGIDLSPIQPTRVPPNVWFLVDDCEAEWVNGSGWDFAHLRQMTPTLTDVPRVVEQIFAHLKPGGWIELQEFCGIPLCDDGTMTPDDAFLRFCNLIEDSLVTRGMSMKTCRELRGTLALAGFTNIHVIKKKIPIGEWQQERQLQFVGQLERLSLLDVIPAVTAMFEERGMARLEREVWAASARRALENDSVHRYFTMYFWVGQKPGPAEQE